MELGKSIAFKIYDMFCDFRTIKEADVNHDYIDGLKEQKKYIANNPANVSISSQKIYINNIIKSNKSTICGLFLNGVLVGTAGIQLTSSESYFSNTNKNIATLATIGIFVFNKEFRGKGLGKVLVWAATHLFHLDTKTQWFGAGMDKYNYPSYKSFLYCGYQEFSKDDKNYKVLANFSDLKKPQFIKEVNVHE